MRSASEARNRTSALWAAALLGALALAHPSNAESFDAVARETDQRLQRSLEELASVRGRIAREKVPLSTEVTRLESDVLALRETQRRLLKVRDSRTIDLGSLRKRVDALREQEEFVNGRLDEFVRDFEGRLDISELGRFEGVTAAARLADNDANLDAFEKREARLAVVRAALTRVRDQLGGHVFSGQALSPEGLLVDGEFVALGPTVFFASRDRQVVGLVENQLNAADPVVVELAGVSQGGIAAVAEAGTGWLPLDATLGKALKLGKARESFIEHVQHGGAVGYLILALGAVAMLLALFKVVEILGFRVADLEQVDDILTNLADGSYETAALRAKQAGGVSGSILTTGLAHVEDQRGVLEELLFEKILRVRPVIERFLPFLAVTAAAAPLLGLLGTVTGMIKTFQLITIFGSGDAKSLSSGISEALVTTELGLLIAIPTLILHGVLSRMAKNKLSSLEQLSIAFINGVETLAKKPSTSLSLDQGSTP